MTNIHSHRRIFLLMLVLILVMTSPLSPEYQVASAQGSSADASLRFGVVADGQGWVIQGDAIYWTKDNGAEWIDITPSELDGAAIDALFFLDANRGWLVVSQGETEALQYRLMHTIDGGMTWTSAPLALFTAEDLFMVSETVSMQWLNEQTGWILFKQTTGVNFSLGMMFQTRDGGASWERLEAPMGEPFTFVDENLGWMAGGPDGQRLYRTQDGGRSWTDIAANVPWSGENARLYFFLPQPTNSEGVAGLLFPILQKQDGAAGSVLLVWTPDQGETWTQLEQLPLSVDFDYQLPMPLIVAENLHFIFFAPGEARIVKSEDQVQELESASGLTADLAQVSMADLNAGWGKFVTSECAYSSGPKPVQQDCTTTTRLMATADGGITWQPIVLPFGGSELTTAQAFSATTLSLPDDSALTYTNAQTLVGQGFDKCEIPSLAQFQAWMKGGPYRAVNLYIGGVSRACSNTPLTATYLSQLTGQGWKFIPTWLGPQAPCSSLSSKMSWDPATAYNQGVAEAVSAAAQLKNLGLTAADGTGSVVYYDMEIFPEDTACYAAAKSFMDGWTTQIHASGNLSGVYGIPRNIVNFFGLTPAPDVIWPAAWKGDGYYNPDASVWNLSYISNSLYANHQRIRQYEGDHSETWGGISASIDSNVIDGVVAISTNASTPPSCPGTTATRATVCTPVLTPAYNTDACSSFWYPIIGFNTIHAYLTENVASSSGSTNSGKWTPNLPQNGRYRVEAYIASHSSFNLGCSWGTASLAGDTTHAQYRVYSPSGSTSVVINQSAYSNQWVSLGEYDFQAGTSGYVTLSDLTGETSLSHSVNFGAMRFVLTSENLLNEIYLPIIVK